MEVGEYEICTWGRPAGRARQKNNPQPIRAKDNIKRWNGKTHTSSPSNAPHGTQELPVGLCSLPAVVPQAPVGFFWEEI